MQPPSDPVTFSHTGQRYLLGYTATQYGVYDRNAPGSTPLQYFPRTNEGWAAAWQYYSSIEPGSAPVVSGPPAPPPYGAPAYGAPGYGAPPRTNGFAVAALVLGILWIYWIGSLLALIFGIVSLGQIRKSEGRQTGRGMAIAGIVLGAIGTVTLVITLIVIVTAGPQIAHVINNSIASEQAAESRLRNGYAAAKVYFTDGDTYTGFTAKKAAAIEPSLAWSDTTTSIGGVHIAEAQGNSVLLVTRTPYVQYLCIADNAGTTSYGQVDASSASACTGGWVGTNPFGD
jgi:hypothetical protein